MYNLAEFELFPRAARNHALVNHHSRYFGNNCYAEQFEIDKLYFLFKKIEPEIQGKNMWTFINHFENNSELISLRRELSDILIANPDVIESFSKISPLHVVYNEHTEELSRPIGILEEYKKTVEHFLKGAELIKNLNPYFAETYALFSEQMKMITNTEEAIKTHYELRADFSVELTKVKADRLRYSFSGFDAKINKNYSLIATENVHGELDGFKVTKIAKKRKKHRDSEDNQDGLYYSPSYQTSKGDPIFKILGVTFEMYELEAAICKDIQEIFSNEKIRTKAGDVVNVRVLVNVEQKDPKTYSTTCTYTINYKDQNITINKTSKGAGGFPFQKGFVYHQNSMVENKIAPVAEEIKKYNKVFKDIETLTAHAKLSKKLLDFGAVRGELSYDSSKQILLKDMRCPSLVLDYILNKKDAQVVPNDVETTNDKNFIITTGATYNGKTTYGISTVQNIVLFQASLPGFFKYAKIYPRSRILEQFSTYRGNLTSGESKNTQELKDVKEILENIQPHALIFLDEIGTGVDPADSKIVFYNILSRLLKLKNVSAITNTHFTDLAAKLYESHPNNILPIAFDYDEHKNPTFKGIINKIATTSEGVYAAEQRGLGKEGLDKIESLWKEKGIL